MTEERISRDEPTYPMGGQVWKHKRYDHEVWILGVSIEGVRFKSTAPEPDEQSVVCSESEFKSEYKFERWRI